MIIGIDAPKMEYKVKFTYQVSSESPVVSKEVEVSKEEFERITGGKN